MVSTAAENFLREHPELLERLYEMARGTRWGLAQEGFARALARSAEHRFRDSAASAAELAAYLDSLHLEDLALACACSDGSEPAWEHFLEHFRPELRRAGWAVAGECRGRELADSLYAELYGLKEREGQRQPLFDYFHGRSKLTTWLRAVLAQRHVDELRASRPFVFAQGRHCEPLEKEGSPGLLSESPAVDGAVQDPERARYVALMQAALLEALGALAPRERLRLSYYYVEELTLAQIGRLLGEHEATASRQLERTRREVREQVERRLRDAKRLSEAQIRLCFEYAQEDWPFDLTGALSGRP